MLSLFTDRAEKHIKLIEAYMHATGQLRDYDASDTDPVFSSTVSLDLGTVVSSVSGPKRPNDRVSVSDMKADFAKCLTNKVNYKCNKLLSICEKTVYITNSLLK